MSLRFPCVKSRSLVAHCTQHTIEPHIERWEKERVVSGAARHAKFAWFACPELLLAMK